MDDGYAQQVANNLALIAKALDVQNQLLLRIADKIDPPEGKDKEPLASWGT